MRDITIEAEVRTQVGKGNGALRREGKVPGIYYVSGEKNISIAVQEKLLKPLIFTTEAHIINLKLNDGGQKSCILRDIQFDPVSERPVHFDFQGLRDDREIIVEVPVVLSAGTPVGVRDGGIVQSFMRRLKVSCFPKYIPEHIEVNILELKVNQFVHVSDLKLENVRFLDSATSAIVGVIPPTVEKEVVAAPGEEGAAEPEVIAKGKKPDEEGAAAEGGAKAPAGGAKGAAPAGDKAAPAKK
jgi:large subunit ribosomal protein L25